jgi:AAA domain
MNTTLAGQYPATATPARDLRVVYLDEPQNAPPVAIDWLWHGYLAAGNLTLLTSLWKAGKTTLVSALLARLGQGGTLAGLPVQPARAVVVSEESLEHWRMRNSDLNFGSNIGFLCRPFRGRPTTEDWLALIDHLAKPHDERRLVVIDPLASFLPARTENDAGTMLEALLPLQRLTKLGISVLVLHHPRKGESAPGRAARGSGALSGHMDILIEMDWFGQPHEDDRRRKLSAFSRHPQTVRRLVIERTPDGKDYTSLGDFSELDHNAGWPVLLGMLEDTNRKITKQGIREQWPADYACPSDVTLWRWLERAVSEGHVRRSGSGRGREPFVYWLPAKEEEWANNPYRLPDLEELPLRDDEAWTLAWREQQRRKKNRSGLNGAQASATGNVDPSLTLGPRQTDDNTQQRDTKGPTS